MRAALLRNGALRRLGGRRGPWLAALTALAVLAAAVGVAVWGTGYPSTRITLARGAAWLASPGSDLVTLLDGPSGLVIGSVRVAVSPAADLVRTGGSALVVEPDQGTVTRIDGATYAVSAPVRFGTTGELRVLAGDSTAYVVDGARGTAAVIDPATLAVQREVALAARPGPGQSVVDGADRLWVVDGADGGLAGFDAAGTARSAAAGPASRLTVVQGRAVLVDPAGGRAGWIGDDARITSWSCFEVGSSDGLQLLGSRAQARVYAAVPETGTLVATDLDGDDCAPPVPVGRPGDAFGELVEAAGFVLVPNRTTGRTAVVDTAAGRVVADLAVLTGPAGRLELLAKDGLVFYNDLDGDRAGMIRFDGRRWDVGPAARKFAGPTLVHGGGGIPPQNPPQGLPAPRQEPDDPDGSGTGVPTPDPSTTEATTTAPTTTTAAPSPETVTVPDLAGILGSTYEGQLPHIEDHIREACGDGTLCLTPTTRVARSRDDPSLRPCTILGIEPAPGASVERGSGLVFVVNRPCGVEIIEFCPDGENRVLPGETCRPPRPEGSTTPARPVPEIEQREQAWPAKGSN